MDHYGDFSSATSVFENETFVATVIGHGAAGLAQTFAIVGGADAARFAIDSATGELSFTAAPNFEAPSDADGDNLYEVVVSVTDAEGDETQTISVAVADADEAPSLNTWSHSFSVICPENGNFSYDFNATDPEAAPIVYSLSGGDAALFRIDQATGVLSFIASPDYETPLSESGRNTYRVDVTASDGVLSDTVSMGVTVLNENEPLSITSYAGADSVSLDVPENGSIAATVAASDVDGDNVRYFLAGGADSNRFSLNAVTGVLSFVFAPDYEAPADAGADNVYDVIVRATDGTFDDYQTLAISVADTHAVSIESDGGGGSAALTVYENQTAVTVVTVDQTEPSTPVYSIAGGADAARFAIDAQTGALSFVAAPNRESPGDANGDNVYDVVVAASYAGLHDEQAIAVTVADVNEAPSLNTWSHSFSVLCAENGNFSYDFNPTDPEGAPIVYSLAGDDAALFTIDQATGVLSFIASPDYETPLSRSGRNTYSLRVTASDGVLSDTVSMGVIVLNENEPLSITSYGGGDSASVSVEENGSIAARVTAVDLDGTKVSYSIAGGADANRFWLDSTGTLRFLFAPDYEAPTDAGGNNVYDVVVRATDGTFSDTQALAIAVADVTTVRIVSDGGGDSATLTMDEGQTAVTTIAVDPTEAGPPTFSIAGGADAGRFVIDAQTGALSLWYPADYENPWDDGADNVFDVVVAATSGSQRDEQVLSVSVADVVSNLAIVTAAGAGDYGTIAMAEDGFLVTHIGATGGVGYVNGGIVDGDDAILFAYDSHSGQLRFKAAPDFEAPADYDGDNVYQVRVGVTDGELMDFQTLFIEITDEAESLTIVSDGGGDAAWLAMDENESEVTLVAAEGADPADIRYGIAGGADAHLFEIDRYSGELRFAYAPDYEAWGDADWDNVYEVDVFATDGSVEDVQSLSVTVQDVHSNLTISSNQGGDYAALAVRSYQAFVTTVAASMAIDKVQYAIAGGEDGWRFTIDPTYGTLSFLSAPNHSYPSDYGYDNVYRVVVSAFDGEGYDTQTIDVRVLSPYEGVTIRGNSLGNTITDTQTVNGEALATPYDDTIYGMAGNDYIFGAGGRDRIDGGIGHDTIIGGAGGDELFGGTGYDTFQYSSPGDSTMYAMDRILDFKRAEGDRINLNPIDANTKVSGNQAFSFIGNTAFKGVAGQLRYEWTGPDTMLMGDVNGDGTADFHIMLQGQINLFSSDFML